MTPLAEAMTMAYGWGQEAAQERVEALVKEVQAANARAAEAEARSAHRESAAYHMALDEVIRLRRRVLEMQADSIARSRWGRITA